MREARDAIRNWSVAGAGHLALVTILLAAAPWLAAEVSDWYAESDDWPTFVRWFAWGSAWLVSQPLLLTVPRKLRAAAILYAEAFVPRGE